LSTVGGWSAAWSAQHADAFLAYYSSDYVPTDGLTWEEWAAQRRNRLQKAGLIKISIDQPKVAATSDVTARVEFIQTYQSDSYSDQVLKILDMRRENGNWKIYREQASGLNWQVFREHPDY
jgi:ketosteroid isomerase-like protein